MKTIAAAGVALSLAVLPGCIIVATDHYEHPHHASKEELANIRQVEGTEGPPRLRREYHEQLSKLAPGMSPDAFRQVFPDAVFVSEKSDEGHKLDAYSVKLHALYYYRGEDIIRTAHDEAWFYFKDGAFVKWGE